MPINKNIMDRQKEFESDLIAYQELKRQNESIRNQIAKSEDDIVEKYCPYKKGDRVKFVQRFAPNKIRFGIVQDVYFGGPIDGLWTLVILPTKKDFTEINRVVVYSQHLNRQGDKIISNDNK